MAVATLFLGGCFIGFENPLSTPATSRVDLRIEGDYLVGDREEQLFFHIGYQRSGSGKQAGVSPWLDMFLVERDNRGRMKVSCYKALTTTIAGHNYLSMVKVDDTKAKPEKGILYFLARYDFDWRGRLCLYAAEGEQFEAAIKSGALRGNRKVEKDKVVWATDSSEQLAHFVAVNDPKKLFSDKAVKLQRIMR